MNWDAPGWLDQALIVVGALIAIVVAAISVRYGKRIGGVDLMLVGSALVVLLLAVALIPSVV